MQIVESVVLNTFVNRFTQAKSMGEIIKKKSERVKSIAEEIRKAYSEDNSKTAKDFKKLLSEFKVEEITSTLLQQQTQSLFIRALEFYKVIQATRIEIDLPEEDKKFLQKMSESVDLYGMDKDKLVILDETYHNAVMDNISKLPEDQLQLIFKHIVS